MGRSKCITYSFQSFLMVSGAIFQPPQKSLNASVLAVHVANIHCRFKW